MTAWAEKDFTGALAWAKAPGKDEGRSESLTFLAAALARDDPSAAVKFIKDNFAANEAGNVYENVFAMWAESDFQNALSAAQGIADLQLRSRALRAALSKRAETDPREVLDFVRTARSVDLRASVGRKAVEGWIERDLTAAQEYTMALPTGDLRDMLLRQVTDELVRRNPSQALALAEQLPEGERAAAVANLFGSWATRDYQAALEAARGLSDGHLQEAALPQIVRGVIEVDLKMAADLADQLPAGDSRRAALGAVASRWAQLDPEAAVGWYCAKVPSGQRDELGKMMWEWARADPNAALKWAIALPEGSENQETVLHVFSHAGREDPASIATTIENLASEKLRFAVSEFASQWGGRDPEAASIWATRIQDEKAKFSALWSTTSQWANRNSEAASGWIESLPLGFDRDVALWSFSYTVAKTDPEGAVAWAQTIQNPDRKRDAIRDVYKRWLTRNPAAAGNWLQSTSSISPELRADLQKVAQSKTTPQ
jgi:hypothetical protein